MQQRTILFTKIIIPFPKLGIIGATLELNGLIFLRDIPVDIQLVYFLS